MPLLHSASHWPDTTDTGSWPMRVCNNQSGFTTVFQAEKQVCFCMISGENEVSTAQPAGRSCIWMPSVCITEMFVRWNVHSKIGKTMWRRDPCWNV